MLKKTIYIFLFSITELLSRSPKYFFEKGEVYSLKEQEAVVRIFDKTNIEFLEIGKKLIFRDNHKNDIASFQIDRKESINNKSLLYGRFKKYQENAKIFVGYPVGHYVEDFNDAPTPQYKNVYIENINKTPKFIYHHVDKKLMLYVKGDTIIFGQNTDPSLSNFNPYFGETTGVNSLELSSFYMDKYEVTNAEYLHFCLSTFYPLPKEWDKSKSYPKGKRDHPFILASYQDALAYAKWARKRLPTELEWELASRGGLSYASSKEGVPVFPIGKTFSSLLCNTLEAGIKDTLAISQLRDISPYGLIGMCGNAREWTSSWYKAYKGALWSKEEKEVKAGHLYKVIRGGSFRLPQKYARSDFRDYGGKPSLASDHSAGFRLVWQSH